MANVKVETFDSTSSVLFLSITEAKDKANNFLKALGDDVISVHSQAIYKPESEYGIEQYTFIITVVYRE